MDRTAIQTLDPWLIMRDEIGSPMGKTRLKE